MKDTDTQKSLFERPFFSLTAVVSWRPTQFCVDVGTIPAALSVNLWNTVHLRMLSASAEFNSMLKKGGGPGSSVGIATGYWLGGPGI